jgi:lipid-binding SYLF domain-containing protein
MNDRGAHSILSSKVKLGADAAVAAGPKGRDAQAATDVTLRAEILTYSRSRGLFAGISLEGSTVRPDGEANERVYHKKISAEDIIFKNEAQVPPAARPMVSYLDHKARRNQSESKKKT